MKSISRKNMQSALYYLATFLMCFVFWGGSGFLVGFDVSTINLVCLFLFLLSVDVRIFKKREIPIVLALLLVAVASIVVTGSFTLIKIVVFVLCSRGKDIKKVFSIMCVSAVCSSIVTMFSSLITGNGLFVETNFGRGQIERRLSLGFKSPNSLHALFLFSSFCFLIGKGGYKKWSFLVTFLILNTILYFFTVSRTGIIIGSLAGIMLLLSSFFEKRKKKCSKKVTIGLVIGYCFVLLIPLIIIGLSGSNLASILNTLLTNRIILAQRFVNEFGITLMGSRIIGDYVVDLGVVSVIVKYGIIPFIVYFVAQILLIKKSLGRSEYWKVALIFVFLFYGLAEDVMYYVFMNMSIVLFSDLFLEYGRNYGKN